MPNQRSARKKNVSGNLDILLVRKFEKLAQYKKLTRTALLGQLIEKATAHLTLRDSEVNETEVVVNHKRKTGRKKRSFKERERIKREQLLVRGPNRKMR